MSRADEFLASIARLVPADVATLEPDDAPSEYEQIVAAIQAMPAPQVTVTADVPDVDLSGVMSALERGLASLPVVDQVALAAAIAGPIAAAMADLPDQTAALAELTREIVALRKRSTIVGGGPSGSATAVQLQTDAKEIVSAAHPLPVTVVSSPSVGTWGYAAGAAGANGTPSLPAGAQVRQITATALGAQGSFTINGGNTITLPYDSTDHTSSSVDMPIVGTLIAPTIVFDSSVDAYVVQYVT